MEMNMYFYTGRKNIKKYIEDCKDQFYMFKFNILNSYQSYQNSLHYFVFEISHDKRHKNIYTYSSRIYPNN